jgi:hypothetical protein
VVQDLQAESEERVRSESENSLGAHLFKVF